jgi:hypothetical protein
MQMQEAQQELMFPPSEDRGRPGQQLEFVPEEDSTNLVQVSVAGIMEEDQPEEDLM